MTAGARVDNVAGSLWLLADMALNIVALTIVKAMGLDYPALQLVFLRAGVGFALLLPAILRQRADFAQVDRWGLHVLRMGLSTVTLATSFYAIARMPFALFTAINFTRPVLLMLMASAILGERIGRRRWAAAAVALVGAIIAVGPGAAEPSPALLALCVTVVTGTGAVIVTRRLKGTPAIVMMAFYTGGLAIASGPFAVLGWVPVARADLPVLLAVGLFSQVAQLCFLRAHWAGEAGVLGPVSYLSLVFSGLSGFVVFGEVPGWPMVAGALVIMGSALWVTRQPTP